MRLKTLGGAALEGSGLRRPKALLLLAYLAVEGPKDRQHLRRLFWPEAADAALSLRVLLFEVRAVGAEILQDNGSSLKLDVDSDVAELLATWRDCPTSALERPPGAFLDGLAVTDLGAELEDWLLLTRESLARQIRAHLLLGAEAASNAGDVGGAAALAQQAWQLPGAPPGEAEELRLIYRFLSAAGHGLSAMLAQEAGELGIEVRLPSNGLGMLGSQARGESPTPPALPNTATSFVGRSTELTDLEALLADPEIRLLTLLGPGGIGKTRLALEVARRHNSGQVFYVALDTVVHAHEVPGCIAAALGIDLRGGQTSVEALRSSIGAQRLLLVLDNFEQLLPADGTLSTLLAGCAALSILVTSREPLGLDWESVYPVTGMEVTEHDEGDAVRLFVQRARKADVRFRLTAEALLAVVEICRQVDGSPLGIELAAAWVRTLSVQQVSAELRRDVQLLERQPNEPADRHRNLRLIFESAWSRLPIDQRQLLSGLAVFAGGCSREAAAAILGASLAQLLKLVDASLLRMTESSRYDLHPLLFSYVRAKLLEDPVRWAHLKKSHATYFAEQADEAWSAFDRGRNQSHWARWGTVEYANIQQGLEWAQEYGEVALALRLCRDQLDEWVNRGQVQEGIERLNFLLANAGQLTETPGSAFRWGLLTVCHLRHCLDQVAWTEADEQLLDTTLALMREANDATGIFRALNLQAIGMAIQHGMDAALPSFQGTLSAAQRGGFPSGQASALTNLATLALGRLDLQMARSYLVQAVELAVSHGLDLNRATSLALLGQTELHAGAYDQAREHYSHAAMLYSALGRPWHVGTAIQGQGEALFFRSPLGEARRNGDLDLARRLFEEARPLLNGSGLAQRSGSYGLGIADVLLAQGDLEGASTHFTQDLAVAEQRGHRSNARGCLIGLGNVANEQGHHALAWTRFRRSLSEQGDLYTSLCGLEGLASTLDKLGNNLRAVTLWSAAIHIRQTFGLPLHPIYREHHEACLAKGRQSLNAAEFEQAWSAGEQLNLTSAMDLALSWTLAAQLTPGG